MHRFWIAEVPDKANQQHYELPAAFFQKVLGPNLKYSCALWPEGVSTLEQAEAEALKTTCRHADLVDGHHILELGAAGDLSLYGWQKTIRTQRFTQYPTQILNAGS